MVGFVPVFFHVCVLENSPLFVDLINYLFFSHILFDLLSYNIYMYILYYRVTIRESFAEVFSYLTHAVFIVISKIFHFLNALALHNASIIILLIILLVLDQIYVISTCACIRYCVIFRTSKITCIVTEMHLCRTSVIINFDDAKEQLF